MNNVKGGESKDGINNLMMICSFPSEKIFDEIEKEFDDKGYGKFKTAVTETLIEHLKPIRDRFFEIIKDKGYIEKSYKGSAEETLKIFSKNIERR